MNIDPKDITLFTIGATALFGLIKGVWNASKTLTTISNEIKGIRSLLSDGSERMDEHEDRLDDIDDTIEGQALKIENHEGRIKTLEDRK